MTVGVAGGRGGPAAAAPGAAARDAAAPGAAARDAAAPGAVPPGADAPGGPPAAGAPVARGRGTGTLAGQVVATQLAVVGVLAAAAYGPAAVAGAAVPAVLLLAVTWLRLRGTWAFAWLGVLLRYRARRRRTGDPAGGVLAAAAPGARVEPAELGGEPAAVIVDAAGRTAVLELGDPAGLLAEALPGLPAPAALLPPPAADQPPVRLQLLLTGVPAPAARIGGGPPATAYRQLTDSRVLGHARALLAVRVLRAEGWSDEDLHRALSSAVRRLRRRLAGLPARALGEAATLRAVAETAHATGAPAGTAPATGAPAGTAHAGGTGAVAERWSEVTVDGAPQAVFRLRRAPDPRRPAAARLITRLLALPAAATTVSLTAGPHDARSAAGTPAELLVRLTAPDAPALATAAQALRRVLETEHAAARRLDGEQLPGLAATLPLGGDLRPTVPGRPPDPGLPAAALAGLDLTVGAAGLVLGVNRHGEPVVVRLFRPEQTRALLVGGVRCAQLVALRALALGARVVVQTTRPRAWEPFVRGVAAPGESIAVVPPGALGTLAPGSALRPLLLLVDAGPVGHDPRPGAGWQATVVVRDDVGPADVDAASRADLLILQRLAPAEAAVVGGAVGLGDAAHYLTRIGPAMVGVVNRRAVRWAALHQTPAEHQLIGPADRG